MFGRIKDWLHSVAPELQFWGYEGGNVLAAIAGAGGFAAFYNGLISVSTMPTQSVTARIAAAFTDYPDILVTAGLAIIVLATILFGSDERPRAKLWIDWIASLTGLVLVGTALYFGASWITFAAVSFVCASALLRLCRVSPVFLKLGGLMLAAGGLGLAGFGISVIHIQPVLLAILTVLTGIYVVFASLMTYQGGIFECSGSGNSQPPGARHSLFDPRSAIARLLERWIDRPVVLFAVGNRPARGLLGLGGNQNQGTVSDIHVDAIAVEVADGGCCSCDRHIGRIDIWIGQRILGCW